MNALSRMACVRTLVFKKLLLGTRMRRIWRVVQPGDNMGNIMLIEFSSLVAMIVLP